MEYSNFLFKNANLKKHKTFEIIDYVIKKDNSAFSSARKLLEYLDKQKND